MKLYRFRIIPESAWRTPWQSDTLSGMLCGTIAGLEGNDALRKKVIEPALAGRPPFVVSDAFPGDWLPVPASLRLLDCPPEQRKDVKRCRWLARESFEAMQRGQPLSIQDLIRESGFHEFTHLHNTIGRASNTTSDGGDLFSREETLLAEDQKHLTVYVRIAYDFRALFWNAVCGLAFGGYGADRSTGKGQFRIDGELEPADHFDNIDQANGLQVLSTFQPGPTDPTDGAWDAFTKYGKLGPEFGLDNIFKRPLILFKPGASFRTPTTRPWVGRAIRMRDLLSPDTSDTLHSRGIEVVHYAFGLALPIVWPTNWGIGGKTSSGYGRLICPLPPPPKKRASAQKAKVKIISLRPKGGFDVQDVEPGRNQGTLTLGTPPSGTETNPGCVVDVLVHDDKPQQPQYKWPQPPKK